jgi:hypothetical protein
MHLRIYALPHLERKPWTSKNESTSFKFCPGHSISTLRQWVNLESRTYSLWIQTTSLMTFLPEESCELHFQCKWFKKGQLKNFPGWVSNPWTLCQCVIINSRRTKPLSHRGTSVHMQKSTKFHTTSNALLSPSTI